MLQFRNGCVCTDFLFLVIVRRQFLPGEVIFNMVWLISTERDILPRQRISLLKENPSWESIVANNWRRNTTHLLHVYLYYATWYPLDLSRNERIVKALWKRGKDWWQYLPRLFLGVAPSITVNFNSPVGRKPLRNFNHDRVWFHENTLC